MKTFQDLIAEGLKTVGEVFPWDLQAMLEAGNPPLLLDIREPYEFDAAHIPGSLNVPRGILETACEWGYEETVPDLVQAREREIIVICRSGNRSVLAAQVMQQLGYRAVNSLKTGVKGWNDYEQPLRNGQGEEVDIDQADEIFTLRIRPEQMPPGKRSAKA
jgi:rhodanese-related sulfurtransferase